MHSAIRHTVLGLLFALSGVPATAQQLAQRSLQTADPSGSNFINPFPDQDTYRVQVYGESLAEGLLGGLTEIMGREPRLQFTRKHRVLSTLIRGDLSEEAKAIETELEREHPHMRSSCPT